jgi:hypothetical protein
MPHTVFTQTELKGLTPEKPLAFPRKTAFLRNLNSYPNISPKKNLLFSGIHPKMLSGLIANSINIMKNLLKLAICTAICPLVSSGQSIDITNPDNTVDPFSNLVAAMYSDASTLYVPSPFSDFNFALTSPTTGTFTVPGTAGNPDFYFNLVASNPPSFTLSSPSDYAKVGYFGNENWDQNSLSVKDDTNTSSNLFTYNIGGGVAPTVGPPQVATLTVNPQFASASFHFEHTNPTTGTTDQTNQGRFHFFRAYDVNGNALNSWVIGIDDRENDLVDFDDGFFYLQVVPEPSHIAAMAVLGLGALLVIRRRIKAKK